MRLKKTLKGFAAFVLIFVLSAGCMTMALASDKAVEDVEAEEEVKSLEAVALESGEADPDAELASEVPAEEDPETVVEEPEAEPAPSETESSDVVSDNVPASESESVVAAPTTKSEPAVSATKAEPEAAEISEPEEVAAETVESDVNETEEQNVAAEEQNAEAEEQNVETEEVAPADEEPVEMVSTEEFLGNRKDGVYAAFRNAGMSHVGAASVMAVLDVASEFEVSDDGLLGWTDEWKEDLEKYTGDMSTSFSYQIAYLLESIENPLEEVNFDYLKAALMSDDSAVLTDVWYFIQYYTNKVNPENEIDITDCLRLAKEYAEEYDSMKDSYESLTSVFDMIYSTTGSAGGQAVADYACNFVGNPYVWGGVSLTNGADCSGFIQSVYAHFGVALPHYSGALRSVGYAVSAADIQPGDIVCYDGHCSIYIGNGQIVHASNSKPYPAGGIKISSNYNYRTVLAIRRIFVSDVVSSDVVESDVIDIEPAVLTEPEL